MADIDWSQVSNRPKLRIVGFMKLATLVVAIISGLMLISGLAVGYLYYQIPGDGTSDYEALLDAISTTLENAGYYGLMMLFYIGMLWIAAEALDKLDLMVWLNASNAEREEIYSKRKKK